MPNLVDQLLNGSIDSSSNKPTTQMSITNRLSSESNNNCQSNYGDPSKSGHPVIINFCYNVSYKFELYSNIIAHLAIENNMGSYMQNVRRS